MITQTYPLYVTIRTPMPPEPKGPASGLRIAIRLDYLEALLNRVPFDIRVAGADGDQAEKSRSSKFDGVFHLGKGGGAAGNGLAAAAPSRGNRGSRAEGGPIPRTDDLSARRSSRSARVGVGVHRPGTAPVPLRHAAREARGAGVGLGLSARAIGTRGTGSWRVDLGGVKDVSLDIGGILRHLFTCYVNKQLIAADQPHLVNQALLRPFFNALGLGAPRG